MKYGKEHGQHYHSLYDLQRDFRDEKGKITAMDGELELFQEIVDKIMTDPNTADVKPVDVVAKSVKQVAAKLVNDGLTTQTFTVEKAISMTRQVAAPVYVKKIIENCTLEVLEWMRIYQVQRNAKKFGL